MSNNRHFADLGDFELESGQILQNLRLCYHTFGKVNERQDNIIWFFHALTANSDVLDWWPSLVGSGKTFNAKEHFIICINVIGSFYGSSGPRSINLVSGEAYGLNFPFFTVRDVVRTQLLLAKELQFTKIKMAIGGSFGGFQALEFASLFSGEIDYLTVIATSAKETAWSIAIHESQRLALQADSSFFENKDDSGDKGMKAARGIGLLTYRTYEAYKKQQTDGDGRIKDFSAASYIRYQGEKLVKRFHAHCYWHLINCLDTHHIGRNRGSVASALQNIGVPTTVIGIDTDKLVPPDEQKFIAEHIPNAEYIEITSEFGHDGFLIEGKKIGAILQNKLTNHS